MGNFVTFTGVYPASKIGFPHCATSRRSKTTKPKPVQFFQPKIWVQSCVSLVFFPPGILWYQKKKRGRLRPQQNGMAFNTKTVFFAKLAFYMCLTILDPTTFAWNIYGPAHRPKLCLLPGTQSFGFRVVNESHVLTPGKLANFSNLHMTNGYSFPHRRPQRLTKMSRNYKKGLRKIKNTLKITRIMISWYHS